MASAQERKEVTVDPTSFIERAYHDAEDTGKPRLLLVPTNRILPLVDPIRIAERYLHEQYVAIATVCDAVIEVYHTPEPAVIRKYVAELDALADAIERAQREETSWKR